MPTPEAAVLQKNDLHYGKETSSYNVDTCGEVLERVYDKVYRILEIERQGHVIDEFYDICIGDMIDGHNIFKTHPYHADKRADFGRAQVNGLREIWRPQIVRAATWEFEKYNLVIGRGNHSRTGRFVDEDDNYELILADEMELVFEDDPIIKVHNLSEQPARIHIKDLPFLLYHGTTIRMYMKVPWYGIIQRVKEWAFHQPWFYGVMLGHFHTLGIMDEANRAIMLNGCPVTNDEFAMEYLGREATPLWWFYGVHPTRGITWAYKINLHSDDVRPDYLRVGKVM